ncbi:MAG: hypothetical protein IPM11_00620 [Micropruina sp.]|nr:hypothetical protein [Micropruina sp.]
MSLTTRMPSGKPHWPLILLAGVEKSGKTYEAAKASASKLVDRTFWVTFGEDDPDEYGAIPGARFEIVQHDGTYRGLMNTLDAIEAEPVTDKPHLIVLDSGTRLWDLLTDEAQFSANTRAKKKASRANQAAPEGDVSIGMDLWNVAKARWAHVVTTLKDHRGPVLITARLDSVAELDGRGEPIPGRKTWKIKAEKSLPFDVGAIVEMHALGDAILTGVRSLRIKPDESRNLRDWMTTGVEGLWKSLGIADATDRTHEPVDGERSLAVEKERDALLTQILDLTDGKPGPLVEQWRKDHGHPINITTDLDGLRALVASLTKEPTDG